MEQEITLLRALVLAQQYKLNSKEAIESGIKPDACNGTYGGGSKECSYKPEYKIDNKPYCARCSRIRLGLGRDKYQAQNRYTSKGAVPY